MKKIASLKRKRSQVVGLLNLVGKSVELEKTNEVEKKKKSSTAAKNRRNLMKKNNPLLMKVRQLSARLRKSRKMKSKKLPPAKKLPILFDI